MRSRFVWLLGLCACSETASIPIALPLEVAGTRVDAPFEGRDGWQVTLARADLAFGPLYLCSGTQAGALCDTARAEWLGSAVVDALDDTPRRAGALEGTSGMVRSWMYDHGITSLYTQPAPVALDAAEALGGHSLIVEGSASRDGTRVPFVARITIQQEAETELGVPVVRKSASDAFGHDLSGDEPFLRVRFDPRPWLAGVDFAEVGEAGEATLPPDSRAHRAIFNAVVAGERPTFSWEDTP